MDVVAPQFRLIREDQYVGRSVSGTLFEGFQRHILPVKLPGGLL